VSGAEIRDWYFVRGWNKHPLYLVPRRQTKDSRGEAYGNY